MRGFDYSRIPEGFVLAREVDLEKNKKVFILLNVGSLAIAALMFLAALVRHPIVIEPEGLMNMAIGLLAGVGGMLVYMVLHEMVHGVCIRLFARVKPKYGFKGWAAYAGAPTTYFPVMEYLVVALAPVVVWGVVLAVLAMLLPQYFWPIFLVQMLNVSGAIGDYYVTFLALRMPKEAVANDDGVSMRFYAPAAAETEA